MGMLKRIVQFPMSFGDHFRQDLVRRFSLDSSRTYLKLGAVEAVVVLHLMLVLFERASENCLLQGTYTLVFHTKYIQGMFGTCVRAFVMLGHPKSILEGNYCTRLYFTPSTHRACLDHIWA